MSFVGDFNSTGFESWSVDLSSTALTTVFTVSDDSQRYLVKSVIFCNDGASPADVSLQWYDDSNTMAAWIISEKEVAINTMYEALGTTAGPIVLSGSDILKVQASAADLIHVTVTAMLLSRETGR